MKRILTLILTLIGLGTLVAQSVPGSVARTSPVEGAGNGKISGIVIDASNDQPVEFATVALMNPTTNKPIDGTVCDDKGKFTINKIDDGAYKVVVSFIGYESQSFDVTISDKDHNIDLGTVKLGSTAQVLNEVTVEGQKALIEERVDRTVYNAENDMTTRGGDATDVLRRVPLLSVDLDGNVSLRGNGNIRVLINNKPSTIAASSVADALRQIPADQIKSVEVITSPSAKYDAEGSAGIINIITKKNTLQGVTLNINSGFGYRGSNLGLNGNYRNKKMGFSLGGFGRASYNVNGAFSNTQISKADLSSSVQSAETRNNNMFGRYTLGWDYDINKNNYIVASARFGVRNGNSFQDDFTTMQFDQNGVLQASSLAEVETKDNSGTLDLNIDYTHTYEKPGKELSFSTQYSRNNRVNNFWNIGYDPSDKSTILMRRKNENDSYNEETTLQVDYQSPIGKTQMIEMGAKGIMRNVSSDYASFTATGASGDYVITPSASNVFNYNQNITAGYLSYTLTTAKSYAVKAGARYEYTTISANFEEQEGNPDPEIPSYGVLVPSINVSKRLSNNNMIKAAYNRRIQRPSIQFLNPNRQNSNVLFQTIGNPNLDPEFTNNYEVSYSTFIKGTSLNFAAFYRNTNDAIQSVRTLSGDTIFTNYANIGQENAYGLNVFANITIGKLMLNGGADVYYASLSNGDENDIQYRASNTGWVASGRMFGNYNLNKGWGIQFFGFLRGRQVLLQGTSGGFGMYSVGLKKDINDKKGSLGFAAENFFTNGIKIRTETNSSSLIQNSVNELRNMNFRITFSYRIGKMTFDQPRRRGRSINNDDLKDGGSGDMGGGFEMQSSSPSRGGQMPSAQRQAPVVELAKSENDSVIFEVPGTWTYTVETQQGSNGGTITLAQDGDVYKGSIKSTRGETPFKSVEVDGNNVTMIYTLSFNGNEVEVKVQVAVDQDEMNGVMNFGQFRSVPFTAKREGKN